MECKINTVQGGRQTSMETGTRLIMGLWDANKEGGGGLWDANNSGKPMRMQTQLQ